MCRFSPIKIECLIANSLRWALAVSQVSDTGEAQRLVEFLFGGFDAVLQGERKSAAEKTHEGFSEHRVPGVLNGRPKSM
jgi:hypothetical protein